MQTKWFLLADATLFSMEHDDRYMAARCAAVIQFFVLII